LFVAARASPARAASASRVRPGDPAWPGREEWEQLNRATSGRLIEMRSSLASCRDDRDAASCRDLFRTLKNPYAIGDDVGLTQTCGWVDAWTVQPSAYAVAAETADDVVAAVNFARQHNLRLVVKGGGHSYLGTSSAPDSLLIWTHRMHEITLHDGFEPSGCAERAPAVTVGAGAVWMHVYNEVTTKGGRYVQGGGCCTVGVAGLVQGGGFGNYSRAYGTGGSNLLEAEVVTADGVVRLANACTNPGLFWALKGGGGGTFGVVTRLTLRTHELPPFFGFVFATIQASSDAAFRRLIGQFVGFVAENLVNPHWGDNALLQPGNRLAISMEFQGIDRTQADAIWQPFFRWVDAAPDDFVLDQTPRVSAIPARHRWDPGFYREFAPGAVMFDNRPGAPADNMFWASNLSEAGHFLHGFESIWLPAALLDPARRDHLADALCAAGRLWSVELHFQKGLAGAAEAASDATADTPMNPAVLDAFALAIIAGEGPPAFPGLPGHEPDLRAARLHATRIAKAMAELAKVVPDGGTYVAESSFFQHDWQRSYWGKNYSRLLEVKQKYDPDGLFFARHGVGSEGWTEDGFTRLPHP
jgi:FAD/FMN-containing dehydrogenase